MHTRHDTHQDTNQDRDAGRDRGTQDRGPEVAGEPKTYQITQVAHFRQSRERWGGLSNMATGFPLDRKSVV